MSKPWNGGGAYCEGIHCRSNLDLTASAVFKIYLYCAPWCNAVADPDAESYENIVIDEEFARKKGCAMPELVNLLDDQEVLLHLKVRRASMLDVSGFALSFNCQIYSL